MGNTYIKEDSDVPILEGYHTGHQIFQCIVCYTNRKYGFGGEPETKTVLLNCEGICHKLTWHRFLKTY